MNKKIIIAIIVVVVLILIFLAFGMAATAQKGTLTPAKEESKTPATVSLTGSAPTGRYITIRRQPDSAFTGESLAINIAEITVYDSAGNKIAPASATSSSDWGGNMAISKMIDGDEKTFVHTGLGKEEWVKVDLGSNLAIGNILILPRQDCCWDRLMGCEVTVTTSDGTTKYRGVITKTKKESYNLSEKKWPANID